MAKRKTKITTKEASESVKKTGKRKPPQSEIICEVCGKNFSVFSIHKHRIKKCPDCRDQKPKKKSPPEVSEFNPETMAVSTAEPFRPVRGLDVPKHVIKHFREQGLEPDRDVFFRWLDKEQCDVKGLRDWEPVRISGKDKISSEILDFVGGRAAPDGLERRGTVFLAYQTKEVNEAVKAEIQSRIRQPRKSAKRELREKSQRGFRGELVNVIGEVTEERSPRGRFD